LKEKESKRTLEVFSFAAGRSYAACPAGARGPVFSSGKE
jgi:hypothetical protein